MTSEIIVAVIAALGGLSGSVIGMVRSSRLVNYRIDQLEKKVDAYEKAKNRQGSPLRTGRKSGSTAGTGTRAECRDREDREVGRRRSGNNENRQVGNLAVF